VLGGGRPGLGFLVGPSRGPGLCVAGPPQKRDRVDHDTPTDAEEYRVDQIGH
jgi:hypothetical protein